jgi:hypothetical protein
VALGAVVGMSSMVFMFSNHGQLVMPLYGLGMALIVLGALVTKLMFL